MIRKLIRAETFWRRVDRSGDCWLWTGPLSPNGYGACGGPSNAHRIAWKLTYGDPSPLYVLHRCDNRRCVNPAHLFLGTQQDNIDDAKSKGRIARGERLAHRKCKKGAQVKWAKLTENQIPEIKVLYANLKSYEMIAKLYGVTRAAIHQIIKGRSWRSA